MVKKSVLLINDESSIKIYEKTRSIFGLNKEKNSRVYEAVFNEEFKNSIRNHQIHMIFEGEEFYIKLIRIPRCRGHFINSLITNELTYIFKDIDQFNFTYDTFSKGKKHIDVLVFCINSEKNNIFNKLAEGCSIKGIYLIQLCFFEYIKEKIKCYKSIIIVEFNKHMYIMAGLKGKVIANSVIKEFDGNIINLYERIEYTISRADEFNEGVQELKEEHKVFLLNIKDREVVESLKRKYLCTNFDNINLNDIVDKAR